MSRRIEFYFNLLAMTLIYSLSALMSITLIWLAIRALRAGT